MKQLSHCRSVDGEGEVVGVYTEADMSAPQSLGYKIVKILGKNGW